jgi:hypothetical protein
MTKIQTLIRPIFVIKPRNMGYVFHVLAFTRRGSGKPQSISVNAAYSRTQTETGDFLSTKQEN